MPPIRRRGPFKRYLHDANIPVLRASALRRRHNGGADDEQHDPLHDDQASNSDGVASHDDMHCASDQDSEREWSLNLGDSEAEGDHKIGDYHHWEEMNDNEEGGGSSDFSSGGEDQGDILSCDSVIISDVGDSSSSEGEEVSDVEEEAEPDGGQNPRLKAEDLVGKEELVLDSSDTDDEPDSEFFPRKDSINEVQMLRALKRQHFILEIVGKMIKSSGQFLYAITTLEEKLTKSLFTFERKFEAIQNKMQKDVSAFEELVQSLRSNQNSPMSCTCKHNKMLDISESSQCIHQHSTLSSTKTHSCSISSKLQSSYQSPCSFKQQFSFSSSHREPSKKKATRSSIQEPAFDPKAVFKFGSCQLTGQDLKNCKHSGKLSRLVLDLFGKLFSKEEMALANLSGKVANGMKDRSNVIPRQKLDEERINGIKSYICSFLNICENDEERMKDVDSEVKRAIQNKINNFLKTPEAKNIQLKYSPNAHRNENDVGSD